MPYQRTGGIGVQDSGWISFRRVLRLEEERRVRRRGRRVVLFSFSRDFFLLIIRKRDVCHDEAKP
jgi:hypothetical protein